MDVPAWFARDLTIFPQVLDALKLYDHQSSGGEQRQIEILYIEDFIPEGNIGQQDAVTDFLRSIESAVKAPIRRINIHNAWRNSAPVDEKDLRQFLYEVRKSDEPVHMKADVNNCRRPHMVGSILPTTHLTSFEKIMDISTAAHHLSQKL